MGYYFESDTPSYSDPKKLEADYKKGEISDYDLREIIKESKSQKCRNKAGRLLLSSPDSSGDDFEFLAREFERGQRVYSQAWTRLLEWTGGNDLTEVCYALVQVPSAAKKCWLEWYGELKGSLIKGEYVYWDSNERAHLSLVMDEGDLPYNRQACELLLLNKYDFSQHELADISENFPGLLEEVEILLNSG